MTKKPDNPFTDKNVREVSRILFQRMTVGMAKYGTTTDKAGLNPVDWLRHFMEEMLDGAVYSAAAIRELEEGAEYNAALARELTSEAAKLPNGDLKSLLMACARRLDGGGIERQGDDDDG